MIEEWNMFNTEYSRVVEVVRFVVLILNNHQNLFRLFIGIPN